MMHPGYAHHLAETLNPHTVCQKQQICQQINQHVLLAIPVRLANRHSRERKGSA
nr:hypothetical protein [Salmonella enterica]